MDSVLRAAVYERAETVGLVPEGEFDRRLDDTMAFLCVDHGTDRHVGRLREHYLPTGFSLILDGIRPDSGSPSGGNRRHLPAFRSSRVHLIRGAVYDRRKPHVLKPAHPQFHLDRRYALWAMGLLAETHPDLALKRVEAGATHCRA